MVPIFDLDDTLYPERTFVESGFLAVALMFEQRHGWSAQESLAHMQATLKQEGRGAVFNRWLQSKHAFSTLRVRQCVDIYRHHRPTIELAPMAREVLGNFSARPYLVTDGHKIVQKNKVDALGLKPMLQKVYITHQYGIRYEKPSIYCFDLIRKRENCAWNDMFYVGDNPAKDFVNLNLIGVHTIRITTGEHAQAVAQPGFDAKYSISALDELEALVKEIFS